MSAKTMTLPDLNWFEFEVLTHLMSEKKYGNQLLAELNEKFGEDSVSSGKLYPVLQKLEKKGFLQRSKASGKSESARGVDPVHYVLTNKGRQELEKTCMHTVATFFGDSMDVLRQKVALRALEMVAESGEPPYRMGIALPGSEKQIGADVMTMLSAMKDLEPMLIIVDDLCGKCNVCKQGLPDMGSFQVIKASKEDIPLKDGHLDVFLSVLTLRNKENWMGFMKEGLRATRKGGLVILVEFGVFNSIMLEEIMTNIHRLSGGQCDIIQQDEADLIKELDVFLKETGAERVGEMILVHGRKK